MAAESIPGVADIGGKKGVRNHRFEPLNRQCEAYRGLRRCYRCVSHIVTIEAVVTVHAAVCPSHRRTLLQWGRRKPAWHIQVEQIGLARLRTYVPLAK